MRTPFLPALRMLLALTALCGVAYPLAVTGVARLGFAGESGGSLVHLGGRAVGSRLLAQPFTNAAFFHCRPSAAQYATVPSGAGNQGGTSAALRESVAGRRAHWMDGDGRPVPPEMLLASGSGLDPHISPEAARYQLGRVARARGFSRPQQEACERLIRQLTEGPQLGFLGESRVNVLLLNLALDEYAPPCDER
ncbi:MAG: potassium-transporting ATPase subunit KdpC [Verrucomicrobia bacterium]|nr:potassium-transporting ATPase subunit KdpC [Verrucomicrobiota bacterium]